MTIFIALIRALNIAVLVIALPRKVNLKVREMLRRLRKQDKFKLLEKDIEFKKLLSLIDIQMKS